MLRELNGQAEAERPHIEAKGLGARRAQELTYSAPDEQGEARARRAAPEEADPFKGVGRNEACPCGSGKKFKLCHGRTA
ncbi:SEC-C metal-binding domain-containing protein [Luteococcus sediminum]